MRRMFLISMLCLMLPIRAQGASGDFGRQMLEETNIARTAPQRYAEYIREFRGTSSGRGTVCRAL